VGVANLDGFFQALGALQERWDNRLTGKDLRALGKTYAEGRASIALYARFSAEAGQVNFPAEPDDDMSDLDTPINPLFFVIS